MSLHTSRGRELITVLGIRPSARQLTASEGSPLASHVAGIAPSPLCASVYTTTNGVVVPTTKLVSVTARLAQGRRALPKEVNTGEALLFTEAFHCEASPSLPGAQCSCCGEGRLGDPQSHGAFSAHGSVLSPGTLQLGQGLGDSCPECPP